MLPLRVRLAAGKGRNAHSMLALSCLEAGFFCVCVFEVAVWGDPFPPLRESFTALILLFFCIICWPG